MEEFEIMSRESRNRKHRQEFYLSDDELKVVISNMEKLNISNKSEYFREMSIKGKKIIFKFDRNIYDLVTEINKIGVNINQIAKVTNERKNIYNEDIRKLQEEIQKIRRIIDKEFVDMTRELKKSQDESFMEIYEENFKI